VLGFKLTRSDAKSYLSPFKWLILDVTKLKRTNTNFTVADGLKMTSAINCCLTSTNQQNKMLTSNRTSTDLTANG